MAVLATKVVFSFSIFLLLIQGINCLVDVSGMPIGGTPEMYSLLDNVTSAANVAVRLLEHQLEKQQQNHVQQLQFLHQTLTQIAATQEQVADAQTQMANAFNQVVTLLQMQSHQQQNMTATLNNVVSILEDQQKTMENTSHLLTTVLEQQANQVDIFGEKQLNDKITSTAATLLQTTPATTSSATPTTVGPLIQDCSDPALNGDYSSGVYIITPNNGLTFEVYCDMDIAGGGWTVFQKRFNGSVDFHRGWTDFEEGFGNLDGEFWLGLQKIHQLTQSGQWILRVDLEDFDGNTAYAEYESFQVSNAISNYTLSIRSYGGTAGDSLRESEGRPFSTSDSDDDSLADYNCAVIVQGAGWYDRCLHPASLNGGYLGPSHFGWGGIVWYEWKNLQSLAKTEMKIRRML